MIFVILISLLFFSSSIISQPVSIYGVVSDGVNGEPITGANVFIENTKSGATTNEDGYLFLSIFSQNGSDLNLMIQYIGYKTESLFLDSTRNFYNIKLFPSFFETDSIKVFGSNFVSGFNLARTHIDPTRLKHSVSPGKRIFYGKYPHSAE